VTTSNPTVAVLLRCEHQEFQQAQAAAAIEVGRKECVSVEVAFADNSPFTQIRQVHAFAKRPPELRPAAIIIELVGATEGYATTARSVMSMGMEWVEVSGLAPSIPLLRAEFPQRFVMSVTTDEEGIGRIHAKQCRALLPTGGNILYIEGPSLQPEVQARRKGLEDGLKGTRIAIGRTLDGDWTEESAQRTMNAFLHRSPEPAMPALVCAQNDEMALGSRRVAVARHLEWARIPYLGCDGLPGGSRKYLEEGHLTATVIKPVTTGVAVDQVARALRRKVQPRDIAVAPKSLPPLDTIAAVPSPTDDNRSLAR
jgi:ABC-type sugar transport system substrate-binding protein